MESIDVSPPNPTDSLVPNTGQQSDTFPSNPLQLPNPDSNHSGSGKDPSLSDEAALNAATWFAKGQLDSFASDEDFLDNMEQAFGNDWQPQQAEDLIQNLASGEAMPEIEVLPASDLEANSAFGEDTIYLSNRFLNKGADNSEAVSGGLLEEIGHYVDQQLRSNDSPGDEGNIFARLVQNKAISETGMGELKTEDDSGTIAFDGEEIPVELSDYDVLIQAGHEGKTGGASDTYKTKETNWTPIVADEATRILEEAGVSVKRVNAEEIKGETYNVKDAVFIHFDGSTENTTSGASVGYDDSTDKPAADAWKELYSKYWDKKWQPDNFTPNLRGYYGFSSTITSDAELVLELGDLTESNQAKWLDPRLEWEGALIAHFLSERIDKGNVPDPGQFSPSPENKPYYRPDYPDNYLKSKEQDGNLIYDENEEVVEQWQKRMDDLGWSNAEDGLYGDNSARIAKEFQQKAGLLELDNVEPGVVGQKTWNASFEKEDGGVARTSYTIKSGDTLSQIAQDELGNSALWEEIEKEDGTTFTKEEAGNLEVGQKVYLPDESSIEDG